MLLFSTQTKVAYHIQPLIKTISHIKCPNDLKAWQSLVGGLVQRVPAIDLGKNTLFVDEEAFLKPGPFIQAPWFFKGFAALLIGNGLLLGGGGGVDCKLTHEEVLAKVTWVSR